MNKLPSLFIALCFTAAIYSGYRAIDSMVGIFDGRNAVTIAEIETTGRVEVASIQADRDVQIATINAQRDVTNTCIVARWNAYRCIDAGGVPGTRRPMPSAWQMGFLLAMLIVGGIGIVWFSKREL